MCSRQAKLTYKTWNVSLFGETTTFRGYFLSPSSNVQVQFMANTFFYMLCFNKVWRTFLKKYLKDTDIAIIIFTHTAMKTVGPQKWR